MFKATLEHEEGAEDDSGEAAPDARPDGWRDIDDLRPLSRCDVIPLSYYMCIKTNEYPQAY